MNRIRQFCLTAMIVGLGWGVGAGAAAQDREAAFLAGETNDCPGCNLDGANLKMRDLTGADLSGAILSGVNMHRTILAGANLSGATINLSNLNKTILRRANLSGADLSETLLYEADLSGADLTGASLVKVLGGRIRLIGADLSNADLTFAFFEGGFLTSAILAGAILGRGRHQFDGRPLEPCRYERRGRASRLHAGGRIEGCQFYWSNPDFSKSIPVRFNRCRFDRCQSVERESFRRQYAGSYSDRDSLYGHANARQHDPPIGTRGILEP